VSFWELGSWRARASSPWPETGSKTLLQGEIQAAIGGRHGGGAHLGRRHPVSPGMVTESFTITESYPLVTLVSMLAPSPDWFVGVTRLNLRENGEWVPVKVVDLLVHDAGTDSGISYGSRISRPCRTPIYIKTEVPFAESNLVGTFTFELTPTDRARGNAARIAPDRTLGRPRARRRPLRGPRLQPKPGRPEPPRRAGALGADPAVGRARELREIAWDGRDHKGDPAATGVIFATLREGSQSRKREACVPEVAGRRDHSQQHFGCRGVCRLRRPQRSACALTPAGGAHSLPDRNAISRG